MKPDLNPRVLRFSKSCRVTIGRTALAVGLVIALVLPISVFAQVATGYSVSNFATGFTAMVAGAGPIGMAFDSAGNLYVGEYASGFLYKFGKSGGTASTANQLNTAAIPGSIAGMAFAKDGNLYLVRQAAGDLVQVDPMNGSILRTVVTGLSLPTGLAVDPLSGDLFISASGTIVRISNFATGTGTATVYATPGFVDGLSFGSDGTLFAALSGTIGKITGTNSAAPGTVTVLPVSVPTGDGIAVSANPSNLFLYSNRNDGILTKVDFTVNPPVTTDIFTGGSRGDFVNVGPDGCLYATQSDRILKVTNSDGSCLAPPLGPLFPSNPVISYSFSAFCAELGKRDHDEKGDDDDDSGIALHAKFRLAHNSDGIDLASDSVALSVGSVSITIPAGSFKKSKDGDWRFRGDIDSMHIRAMFRVLKSPGAYALTIEIGGAELNPANRPYTVILTIGNDSGTTVAWEDHDMGDHHDDD